MTPASHVLVAYLVDPAVATIRAVGIGHDHFFWTVRRLIGCEFVEPVRLDATHVAYCDSQGVMEPVTGLWTFPARLNMPPIAGRAVIVGNNGESGPTLPMRSFAAMITAYRPVIIPDAAALARLAERDTTDIDACIRRLRVDGFHLEIERRHPLTIDGDQP